MKVSRLDFVSESAILYITREECRKHLELTVSVKDPTAYLLIGQPGAGKTRIATMVQQFTSSNTIFINNDANRVLHPFYQELFNQYKDKANELAAPFASRVTENMIDILSDKKRNLIIEGTGNHVDVQLKTARELKEKGYRVNVSVMAEKPAISQFSAVLRGVRMEKNGLPPRYTSFEAQSEVLLSLPSNITLLYQDENIDEFCIWNRKLEDIFKGKSLLPEDILIKYWNEALTGEEIEYVRMGIKEIEASHVDIPEDHKKYLQHMKKYCAEIQRKSVVSLEKKLAETAGEVAKQSTDKVKCVAHVAER